MNVMRLEVGKAAENKATIELLEDLLERAKKGEINQINVVYDTGEKWGSVSSYSNDTRKVSAMLIELGVRGLLEA